MTDRRRPVPLSTLPGRLWHALTKGPGLYPLKGIVYFLSHPFLYPLLRSRLLPAALLSLFILFNLFFWTYLLQVAFLAIWAGRSAWLNATVLVLGEGAAITALLFEAFFVDETQVDCFDAVLVAKGHEELVSRSRPVAPVVTGDDSYEGSPVRRLGKPMRKAVFAPFSLRQIVELVLLLPVNFIPWAGVPLFLIGTGYRAGPLLMWRYYTLREMTKKERKVFIRRRRWSYAWFGIVHLVLQLVPVLNMFFLLCTAAGAALYAADEEDQRLLEEDVQPADGQPYHDDPI